MGSLLTQNAIELTVCVQAMIGILPFFGNVNLLHKQLNGAQKRYGR